MMIGDIVFKKEFCKEETIANIEEKESSPNENKELFGYNIAIEYTDKEKKVLKTHQKLIKKVFSQ